MTASQPRPGSIVTSRVSPPARTIPTFTGRCFWAGFADRGPLVPTLVRSVQEFNQTFGARQSYSPLSDAVEFYFKEGGADLYLSRVTGPNPVIASVTLLDSASASSLIVKAKGPGAYANSLRITVVLVSGGYTLQVSDTVLGVLEVSPKIVDQQSAVNWSKVSSWVDISLGVSALLPDAISNAAMASGTDDRSNATDATWMAALGRFTKDYGPGQVCQVGRTTNQAYADTLLHASLNNRVGILDLPDSANTSTLKTSVSAVRGTNDRYGAMFGPWVVVPGVLPGTTRVVPPCAFVCAKIAQSDGSGNSPNDPAAGNNGILSTALGLSQTAYDNGSGVDITRDDLYSAGINLITLRYNAYEVFGWRSIVDPVGVLQDWLDFGNCRLNMAILAQSTAIAENYVLKDITQSNLSKFNSDLVGMMLGFTDALYGDTPEEKFQVDTSGAVNTPATMADKELHASIAARMNQDAELVIIEFTKVPVTQSLPSAALAA